MVSRVQSIEPISHQNSPVPTRQILASTTLGFRPRVVAHSHAPVVPQRVGNWWLEPLRSDMPLPSRARTRLEALMAAGVKPKAIVVFHEIPPTTTSQSHTGRLTAQFQRFANQELPVVVDRVTAAAKRHGPTVGRFALGVGAVTVAGAALAGASALLLAGSVAAAAIADPCLVVVTEDGDWIEVDRWYD